MNPLFHGQSILVTGACGTVGSELIRQLLTAPAYAPGEVIGIDNNESEVFFLDQHYLNDGRARFFVADVRDEEEFVRKTAGVDIVFHCAEMLEEHLTLAGAVAVEGGVQCHLDAGQIQREDLGVLDDAARDIAGNEAQVVGVGSDDAQAMPARYADVLIDERKQTRVQIVEDGVRQMLASLGQGLGADGAHEFGLIARHGEEAVEFGLHASARSAEEPADQGDEVEDAAATEMPGISEMARTQRIRMQVGDELGRDRDNPSAYREILRMTVDGILPAQPFVYKAGGLS